jgi:hypothetical protein
MSRTPLAASLLLALTTMSCTSTPPLAGALPSAESLADRVLQALAKSDTKTLQALALNEQEFREHVWPELPAAKPERNLPFSYVWGDLRQKSDLALAATIKRYGGTRFKLRRIEFEGETDHRTYRVHRQTTFRVQNAAGEETPLRVCGSMIEKDGSWKVFSYVVDD